MNTFMDKLYTSIGTKVSGSHCGIPFTGTITSTRAKYGEDIGVTIQDENNIWLLNGSQLMAGEGGGYTNLKVHFVN